jgi:hypothetical protein
MELGEGWSRSELAAVWRALLRIPLGHVARNEALVAIRRAATPPEAAGRERQGVFVAETATILLRDAAFAQERAGEATLDQLIAELVGQSLWRRYRQHLRSLDQEKFGALYARYHLDPQLLDAADRERLAKVFVQVDPAPPSRQEMIESLRPLLPDGKSLVFVAGPPPLEHVERCYPFAFFQAVGGTAAGTPLVHVAAYDVVERQAWYRTPAAFEAFLRQLRYTVAPERVPAEALLVAWHSLTRGLPPQLLHEPEGVMLSRVRGPMTHADSDGTLTTVGWTRSEGRMERHQITVAPDGKVTVRSEAG